MRFEMADGSLVWRCNVCYRATHIHGPGDPIPSAWGGRRSRHQHSCCRDGTHASKLSVEWGWVLVREKLDYSYKGKRTGYRTYEYPPSGPKEKRELRWLCEECGAGVPMHPLSKPLINQTQRDAWKCKKKAHQESEEHRQRMEEGAEPEDQQVEEEEPQGQFWWRWQP